MLEMAKLDGAYEGRQKWLHEQEVIGGKKVKFDLANKFITNGLGKTTGLYMVELTELEYDEIGRILHE